LKPRSRFGETTVGNCVTFMIDGEENFRLIYQKMSEAKNSIYIANYDLDPNLQLIRSDALSRSIQITDLIASACTSESLLSQSSSSSSSSKQGNSGSSGRIDSSYDDLYKNDNTDNDDKKYHQHSSTLQNLLIQKAKQKVDIKIIVWEPRSIARKLPTAKKRGLEGREQKVEVIKEAAKHLGIEDYITIRLDSKAPTLTSGFHEKIIIIDNQTAFCGGQDLSHGKWDTSDHDFDNPLRDPGGGPWHDIQVMIKGPILWDLIYHFNQRWVYSIWKDVKRVKEIVKPSSIGSYLASTSPVSLSSALSLGDKGDIEITALRTWKQLNKKNSNKNNDDNDFDCSAQGGSSIRAWYETMFRKAKDSIYVEDQFLFQDKAITQILVNRLREEKNLKIITLGPMEPNLPGFIFSVISKESVNNINNNLAALRKAGENRVRTYSLISQHKMLKESRKQIYIHSKLMIIDDKWITVGSANTDRDGFEDSTEFDLGIVSANLSQRLRVKLWREHLRVDDMDSFPPLHSSEANNIHINLYNFEEGFNAWETLAEENGKRVRKRESILGHIYYYNFEEMNYPPPYPQAKGSNKFRLF
jgi:phosphatidylserine/phosphatidylglycerophosphate/cardiolipin synthase-like enzyme